MMRRFFLLTIAMAVTWVAYHSLGGAVIPEEASLPGAEPTIDAARYASLQAAIDALPSSGGLVRLPAGRFEIEQPIVIHRGDICLEGAGSATRIVNTNISGQPAIVLAAPEHQRAGNDRRHELWRIRLANLRVTGNTKSGHGIIAYNINELFIDGITVSQHGADGIHLSYCYEDPRIVDSLITYNKQTGLNLQGCHDIVVSSNQFEENQDGIHCVNGFNLCMTGNCLDDHLGQGVVIENTYGSVVSGNMIEECQAAALVLDRDCYGNTVSANVVAHNGAGIDVRDAHGCTISANAFTIMNSAAVRLRPNSSRIAVCANHFSDSYIGGGRYKRDEEDRGAAGLVIEEAAEVFVNGNMFSGVGPIALKFTSNPDQPSVVSENFFVGTRAGIDVARIRDSAVESNRSLGFRDP